MVVGQATSNKQILFNKIKYEPPLKTKLNKNMLLLPDLLSKSCNRAYLQMGKNGFGTYLSCSLFLANKLSKTTCHSDSNPNPFHLQKEL
jgi:hypothetical protein